MCDLTELLHLKHIIYKTSHLAVFLLQPKSVHSPSESSRPPLLFRPRRVADHRTWSPSCPSCSAILTPVGKQNNQLTSPDSILAPRLYESFHLGWKVIPRWTHRNTWQFPCCYLHGFGVGWACPRMISIQFQVPGVNWWKLSYEQSPTGWKIKKKLKAWAGKIGPRVKSGFFLGENAFVSIPEVNTLYM